VVAIGPDETNQSILREGFLELRFARKPVAIVGKAVNDKVAVESMWIDGPGSAVNTLSPKWATALKENKARHRYRHWGLDFTQTKVVETTTLETLIVLQSRLNANQFLGVFETCAESCIEVFRKGLQVPASSTRPRSPSEEPSTLGRCCNSSASVLFRLHTNYTPIAKL
jgi:hypothetical protein